MKKNLLKSILMAVVLVLGTTGAWADEITATLVHTASSKSESTAGTFISTIDAEKEHINNSKFSGTWAGAAYAEFSFAIPEGQTIQSATLTWKGVGSSKDRTTDVMYANAGLTLNYTSEGEDALGSGTGKADLAATKIANVKFPKNATTDFTTDVTDAVKEMAASQAYVIFKFTNNAGGGDLVGKGAAEGAPVLTIVTTDASAMTSYTVKFTDTAGNELKEAVKYDVLKGAEATASAADMAAFFNADNTMKYIYVSGNQTITATENAESNVITLVFREAEKWNYTINAVDGDGNALKTLKQGTNFEAEKFDVAYAAYINVNGTIYKSSKQSSDGKGYYFTLDLNADNVTKDITFTASDITGVVYFSEAEDINGLTLTTNNNTFIRSSNGASAYAADGDVVFTTLPNGKYKLATVICDATKNAGSVWNFKAGEQNIFEFTAGNVNWAEGTSEEFELNAASTDIILVKNGGMNQGVDLIYIIKTGDAEIAAPVAASGKMTFDGQPTSNNGTEGDITEDKVLTADEFTVTVSPKTEGTTNNRFWDNKGTVELRVYKGTITVKAAAGKTLTKVTFGQSQWGAMTANVGTLNGQTWTGEAEEVVFTVTSQCRISSITVGEFVEPVVDAANIAAFKALAAGTRAKLAVNGAKVTFSKGDYTYIEDETGALLLYKTGLTMTAGKAITGFINGAYTEHNGLPELTAIDVTPASEFTEADTELTATVMTVAEASNVANASKLVKLENVNIDANLQTIKQGEDEIAFYDKFGVMGDYTYPATAKSIVGIINTNSGYNTFHPVSPDSVVAGEVVVPEVENIAAAKAEDVRGTEIKLNVTGAKITLNAGAYLDGAFIEDATGAIMVDRTIANLIGADVNSATLTGHIVGTVAKDQKRGGIFVMSASANTATASEVTNEATTLEATPTTIAEINAGQVCDVTSKYVVLSNVKFNYDEYGDSKLIDGEEEIAFYDALWMIPEATLSMAESFKSIKGIVTYLNYKGGLVFIPYGEYEAVEKELTKVENIAALKNVADGEYIELTLNNAQLTVYEPDQYGWRTDMILEDATAGIQILDQSGTRGDATIFTALGQTFNGTMVLQYMVQDGVPTLVATQTSVSDKYTSEVKDVVAKDVAFADAKSENYSMQLIKVSNVSVAVKDITVGEGEEAETVQVQVITDGTNDIKMTDRYFKASDEMGNPLTYEKCNVSGIIMPYPLYNDTWTEIIGTEDYFVPTVVEEVAVAEARKWQFDAMGEADEALLAADTEHWSVNKYRYQNTGVAFNNEVIKVNDVELEVTKGLLFTAEAGKLLLGSGVNGSNHFMQVQKGSSFVVTNLAVGDTVRMVVQTSDKTEATVEAPAYSVANIIEGFEATKDLHTCTLVMCEAGNLTLKGANHDLRFMSLEVKAGNPNEVANLRKWDFTAWSDETKANLAADAATVVPTEGEDGKLVYPSVTPWRSYEKVGGPTETDPDREGNAYWYGTAIAGSEELVANSVVIAETKGLFFNTVAAGALAIGVNYPKALSDYEGPSYLWIGGKNNSFTIPNVKSGSKITMAVESHKATDARGVTLKINDTEIGRAVPTTYQVFDITVPGELTDNVLSDVVLTNTNGCHIYFITVDATGKTEDAINEVKAVVKTINNDVYTINGVKVRNAGESLDGLAKGLYIIGGKKVVVK